MNKINRAVLLHMYFCVSLWIAVYVCKTDSNFVDSVVNVHPHHASHIPTHIPMPESYVKTKKLTKKCKYEQFYS